MLRDQPFMRDDTFLGVCETLGQGLRIPSNLFRIAIAPALVWYPGVTIGVYLVAGVLVALLHWVIPAPAETPAALPHAAEAVVPPVHAEPAVSAAEEEMLLPLAKAA
jgi:phage shock protein C